MCLRHLNDRLEAVESRNGNGQSDIDQRYAEAEQKRVDMAKQMHIDKIEQAHADYHKKRQEELNPTPDEPPAADKPDGDQPFGGKFDPSVGDRSQKTPKHPMGHPVGDAMALVREGQKAREFFDRELAQKRAMLAQIKEGIAQRWA
jgi:hypothetical protein